MGWMGDPVARDEMPGMASRAEMDGLRSADDIDAWFVTLMVDHHAGGIAMIDAALDDASGDLEALATRMRIAQSSEIGELLDAAEKGKHEVPVEGTTWDVYSADPAHGHG